MYMDSLTHITIFFYRGSLWGQYLLLTVGIDEVRDAHSRNAGGFRFTTSRLGCLGTGV